MRGDMSTDFSHRVIEILQRYCDDKHEGNMRAASRALQLDPETGILSKWLKCHDAACKAGRFPRLDTIGPVMDKIGVVLMAPWETQEGGQEKEKKMAALSKENEYLRGELRETQGALKMLRELWDAEHKKTGSPPSSTRGSTKAV